VVTSVVGAFYYIRIVKVMYFDEPRGAFERAPAGVEAVLLVSTVVVTLFWLIPAPLVSSAGTAARSLFF
jgi:NADH-quinone oxidoreductase subunit N